MGERLALLFMSLLNCGVSGGYTQVFPDIAPEEGEGGEFQFVYDFLDAFFGRF